MNEWQMFGRVFIIIIISDLFRLVHPFKSTIFRAADRPTHQLLLQPPLKTSEKRSKVVNHASKRLALFTTTVIRRRQRQLHHGDLRQ